MNRVWKFSHILYHSKYGISICPSLWSAMWVFGEIGIGCLLVSALTLISGWSQIRVCLWLIWTSSGEVSSEILWMCYWSCSRCWQIWGMLFAWEFITTDPSSRCSRFILQKLRKTSGFLWCVEFMNSSAKLSNVPFWFTALECKLGEIDCVHAIYAHVSQCCNPCAHGGQILGWVKFLWNWNSEWGHFPWNALH